MLLIISDNEKEFLKDGYYLALKSISTSDGLLKPTRSISRLLSGIASNHHGNFYCMNCSHAFYSEKALGKHEELCDNHKFCKPVMPYKSNILQYSSGEKALKVPHSIYFDLESLLIPHQSPHNNPDKSYTEKKATHEPCSYAINLAKTYGKNKCVKYRGKDCMKKFCKSLREIAMEIISAKEKPMIPLTDDENNQYEMQEFCHTCNERFCNDEGDEVYINRRKVRYHDHYTGKYRGAAHSECNLKYSVQKIIPVLSHNGSNYDYHFIIRELAKEFKGNIECLGENMEKYISFSVPLKVQNKDGKMETFRLKFVDSQRFMNSSLAKLVGYLSDIKETNKETDIFINNMRSSATTLQKSINNYSKLDKKETHEFTDNLRSMTT